MKVCNFKIDDTFSYSTPLIDRKCIFGPSLRFDLDLKNDCVSVTLKIDDLTIMNKFNYCPDTFIYIISVYPTVLQ